MAMARIFNGSAKSRTRRACLKGSLFFLLLHMFNGTCDSAAVSTPAVTAASTSQSSTATSNPAHSTLSSTAGQMTSVTTTSGSGNTLSSMTSASSNTNSTSPVTTTMTLAASVSADSVNTSALLVNGTTLLCPAFTCTTDCYGKSLNETANPCPSPSSYCELIRQDTSYSIACSVSCGMSCGNATLTNCSLDCCNTTNCLNDTLFGLSNSLGTTATTKPTTTSTTIKVTVPPTPANNGKRCHSIKCDGTACYKNSNAFVYCPIGQDYCMLNKTTAGTTESWLGGCSGDCRKGQACSSSVTSCYLECCNATTSASCLKLTGDLNMPSSATRGPQSPALLTASLLLLWMMKILS